MNCDIYIVFGNLDEQFIITSKSDTSSLPKDQTYIVQVPQQDLDNIQTSDEAIKLLFRGNKYRTIFNGRTVSSKEMIDAFLRLQLNAKSSIDTKELVDKFGVNLRFLDNITYAGLRDKFPGETYMLSETPNRNYHISLIQDATLAGTILHDRIFVNGVETFILRNSKEVKRFALTEKARYLMETLIGKVLEDGSVDDNYINDENNSRKGLLRQLYGSELLKIIQEIKNSKLKERQSIIDRVRLEQGASDLTIKSLLIDYLYHKSEYNFKYLSDNRNKVASAIMSNFFTELKGELASYEDEDEFTASLKELSFNKTEFGKKDLYQALADYYGETFTSKCTLDEFAKADKEKLTKIIEPFFKEHASIQNFQIDSVDETKNEKTKVPQRSIESAFKKKLKQLNKGRKKDEKIVGSISELVTDIDSAKEYIGTQISLQGKIYNIDIVEEDGQLVYYYDKVGINNDQKVKMSYSGQMLEQAFDLSEIGMDTFEFIVPCNETEGDDKVVDGRYHGFYIYETHYPNRETQYFISNSVISPKLYILNGSTFSSLEKAKLAILSYNFSRSIKKYTNLELKLDSPDKATVVLQINSGAGQTLDSLDVSFDKDLRGKLNGSEDNLYNNGNLLQFVHFYKDFFAIKSDDYDNIYSLGQKIITVFGQESELLNFLEEPVIVSNLKQKVLALLSESPRLTEISTIIQSINNIDKLKEVLDNIIPGSPTKGRIEQLFNINNIVQDLKTQILNSIENSPEKEQLIQQFQEKENIRKLKESILNDLSSIDTPEKAGVFILKLKEFNITSYEKPKPDLTSLQTVLDIINTIKQANTKQFLVRNSRMDKKANTNIYITNLQALSDVNLTVNSQGNIVETGLPAYKSLTLALNDLAGVLNKSLFKDSGIEIRITDNDALKSDDEFIDPNTGKSIFEEVKDMRSIHGFVYNGNIYINQSNIEGSVKTLYHEIFHIVLGAIRARDRRNKANGSKEPSLYEAILSYYESKWRSQSDNLLNIIGDKVGQTYRLAYQDQLEEIVVRYLASSLGNTKAMYLNSKGDDFENNILSELLKQFQIIQRQVQASLTSDVNFDLGFVSDVIKSDGTRDDIIYQARVTSLIEKGLNTYIKQKC